ncbi:MAG TPA: sulfur carrier protein ThiS [Pyrinomonadaceae bacterium]|jgi:sulfur carrier protein|nr:sulfur carrier protein ThiS [Pyrinomonadaceae bacterium]
MIPKTIGVKINGEIKQVPPDINLAELLKHLELPAERLAVELNSEVVRRINWENVKVKDADKIEIVHFVGGG